MIISSGFLIIKGNKVLLIKPNGINKDDHYSIPKGIVERGENLIQAAIRETYEEVGICISKEKINSGPFVVNYMYDNLIKKKVYFFIVDLTYMNLDDEIDKNQTDLNEVEFAKFYEFDVAIKLVFWRFRGIFSEIFRLWSTRRS